MKFVKEVEAESRILLFMWG